MKKFIFSLMLLITASFLVDAQSLQDNSNSNGYYAYEYPYWADMMNDISTNFYDVKEAFNEYFEDKPTGKGTGWKQFQRWAWLTEQRVYPSGERINQAQVWNEINKFKKKYPLKNDKTRSNWVDMGPHTYLNNTGHWNPGLGRINVIARDPINHNTIYIGAPSGGLWKTTNEGENWVVLTDELPVMGVSAIAIHPTSPNIIYIGTGDKDASDNYSIGVLKSIDGGYSWELTGLDWTIYQNRTIAKLLIHPTNPDVLFAATSSGLYKTIDAGESWYLVQTGDIDDLEFKPGNPEVVYAITKKFYLSVDGGETFELITDPPSNGRAQIAVTEANPDYVYFYSSVSGVYRSSDSGATFEFRSPDPSIGSQAWYDLALAASHVDPEEVHLGEINTYRSTNGGTTWIMTTDWTWNNPIGYTHCDIHEMVFFGGTLYVGSDGLITKSTDSGDSWTDLSIGINIRQFYRIGCSQNSLYKILGGSQDNGTSVFSYDHWHEWLGADGMECVVNYNNENIVYGTSQFGNFYKSTAGGNFGNQSISQPGMGAWVTPFVIHPTDPDILFVGNSYIKKTTNGMSSWTTMGNISGSDFNALAISNSNPDYLYASRSSTIYRTVDGGLAWNDISGSLPNLFITYIAVHPSDPEIVAISFSGYTEEEKVYISFDAGSTWENHSSNLPNLPANCVIFYDDSYNSLYVGMDVGVYYRDNTLEDWEPFFEGLPNVIVSELDIHYNEGMIRAGTYGRGLWESHIRAIAPEAEFSADKTLIPIGCSINFTNLSSGPPETYEWTFEGGTPSTSNEKNPSDIIYESEGTFDVTLSVTNSMGSSSITKEDYISVSTDLLPEPDFSSSKNIACSEPVISFYDQTGNCPSGWFWEFTPGSIEFMDGTDEYSQNPVVKFNEDGSYSVSLTATNSNGEATIIKEDNIIVGGVMLPFTEDFESGSFSLGSWTIDNPDNDKTWEITTVGGNTPGDKAYMVNMFNYFVPPGQRDRLISPPLNLTGYQHIQLQFQHAYAQKYATLTDSLIVYISDDCGDTWVRIFSGGEDGSGIFATHPQTSDEFIPSVEDDWCGAGFGPDCNIIDISSWAGSINVKIMFESYNFLGNNLFIDNIVITSPVGTEEPIISSEDIHLFPNPSDGQFNLYINSDHNDIEIHIINLQGQKIMTKQIAPDQQMVKLDLNDQAKGIYFVEIISGSAVSIKKLIIR